MLQDHPEVLNIFEGDTACEILESSIRNFPEKNNEKFSNSGSQEFVNTVIKGLKNSAENCWIFFPLQNAVLSKTIRFDNIVFVAGTKDEKLEIIQEVTGISSLEVGERANHTVKSKDPGFYSSPLFGIRVEHQFDYVGRKAKICAIWLISIIHAIYWGLIYPEYQQSRFSKIKNAGTPVPLSDLAEVWGQRNYEHWPLGFKARCDLDLNWLEQPQYQEKLISLVQEILEKRGEDKLRLRFFKGFRFFLKAIYSEENKDPFDGIELTTLYLIVIAEGLLLHDNASEMRCRLKVLLSRLSTISGTTLNEREQSMDRSYRCRSAFVHAGKERYIEWTDDFKKGKTHQDIERLKRMIAMLLCESPQHIMNMQKKAEGNPDIEAAWFGSLRDKYDEVKTRVQEQLSPVAKAFLSRLPQKIQEALIARANDMEYPVEAVVEMAIASFLDTEAIGFVDDCKSGRGQ